MTGIRLTFTTIVEAPFVRIVYRARNEGSERAYLLDQLVEPRPMGLLLSRRPIVMQGDGDVVRLVLGWVRPPHPVAFLYPPAARAIDPGCELSGVREILWPPQAWHPFGHASRLVRPGDQVVLELGVIAGEGEWIELDVIGGETLIAPSMAFAARAQKLVRSAPQALAAESTVAPACWTDGYV